MAQPDLPKEMIGVQHDRITGKLHLESSLPLPKIEIDQYLIKVAATAITNGELLWPRPPEFHISCPGVDAAGVVVAGPAQGAFQAGDKVYFRTTFPRAGSARQYSIALEKELALCPNNISLNQAAAVPTSALTAWQALFEEADLGLSIHANHNRATTKKIFVNGASGGVGLFIIQLARLAGCEIVGISTNETLVRSLGANEVINYRETPICEWLDAHPDQRFDLVLDLVGGDSLLEAWHAAREGGSVITLVPPQDMIWKWVLDRPEGINASVNGKFYILRPDGYQLRQITELFEQGKLKATIDSIHGLEQFEKAFARAASGRAVGKVVMQVEA